MRVPRLYGCSCEGQHVQAKTIQIDGLVYWVSPELEFIQSQLAATIPYARRAELLELLLPVDAGNAPATLRRRVLSVGQRLNAELQESLEPAPVERSKARTDPVTAVGLDSGYVHDCRPDSEGSFEVVVGRILSKDKGSRRLGFVRTIECNRAVSDQLKQRLSEQGPMSDDITVSTEGDPGAERVVVVGPWPPIFWTGFISPDVSRC